MSATERGVAIAGYGAPSKAAVLLALAGVDAKLLPYTVDLAPAKHGRRIPGAFVPIRPVETLIEDDPDEVVVLTWDIADEVIKQLRGNGLRDELEATVLGSIAGSRLCFSMTGVGELAPTKISYPSSSNYSSSVPPAVTPEPWSL